jgi:hypothetical protein
MQCSHRYPMEIATVIMVMTMLYLRTARARCIAHGIRRCFGHNRRSPGQPSCAPPGSSPTVGSGTASLLVHGPPPALGQSTTPTRLPGTPEVSLPADPCLPTPPGSHTELLVKPTGLLARPPSDAEPVGWARWLLRQRHGTRPSRPSTVPSLVPVDGEGPVALRSSQHSSPGSLGGQLVDEIVSGHTHSGTLDSAPFVTLSSPEISTTWRRSPTWSARWASSSRWRGVPDALFD